MNPLTNVKNIKKLSEKELELGVVDMKSSWHNMYKDSAWIFIGGLHYDLSEGDIIAVFSQYGEIVNINLIRDRKTGKSRGFAFLCYENQRSTVLAVDNFNGIKLLNRIIRVDHVEEYKIPKEYDDLTIEQKQLYNEGCAPRPINQPQQSTMTGHQQLEEQQEPKIRTKEERKSHRKRSRTPEKHSKTSSKRHKSKKSTNKDKISSSKNKHKKHKSKRH